MKNTPAFVSVTFRLPRPLLKAFKRVARKEKKTQSALLRVALQDIINCY